MTPAKTAITGAAALCAAVLVFVAVLLPPAARTLAPPAWPREGVEVRGVYHVHTSRSDGTGTVDQVAAAAARAGLRFVIFTDHGDATRTPDPPAYRSGVLCVDAVEISTNAGHYAALGLGAAPYPLGGDPRDVVEDVARLGGFGVVTHPDSPKAALRWTAWGQPFDAVEWLNADSEWRDEPTSRLAKSLLSYPFRGAETIAGLFARPGTLARWDGLAKGRRVLGLAGSDAHAHAGWRSGEDEPYRGGGGLRLPSYEASFRTFSLRVALDRPLRQQAAADAGDLLAALRAGHVHSVIDAFARPGAFEFTGRVGMRAVREGDAVAPGEEAVILRARSNGPPGTRLVLFRDGQEVTRVTAGELVHATNRAGAYRVEAWLPGTGRSPMPWAVSNPVFVGPAYSAPSHPAAPQAGVTLASMDMDEGRGWHVEHDAQSSGATSAADSLVLRYQLGRGEGRSQFVALAHEGGMPAGATGLMFRGTASSPMRVSVQVRAPKGRDGERWARSVYLDSTPREVVVPFAEMHAEGETSSPAPRLEAVSSVLFVVDRTHAKAGGAGQFSVAKIRVAGAR